MGYITFQPLSLNCPHLSFGTAQTPIRSSCGSSTQDADRAAMINAGHPGVDCDAEISDAGKQICHLAHAAPAALAPGRFDPLSVRIEPMAAPCTLR
jgi:hypothetical protein